MISIRATDFVRCREVVLLSEGPLWEVRLYIQTKQAGTRKRECEHERDVKCRKREYEHERDVKCRSRLQYRSSVMGTAAWFTLSCFLEILVSA